MKNNTEKKTQGQLAMERLEAGVATIQGSDQFKAMLKFASKFHNYSWRNWMLIMMQAPSASRVAGYNKWIELKRQVRKGEKAIHIIAPRFAKDKETEETKLIGFTGACVFDVSQTDGEPLPQVEVPLLVGDDGAALYGKLAGFVASKNIKLIDGEEITNGAAGYYTPSKDEIHIGSQFSMMQRVKTLAHEIGHALAGHGKPEDTTSSAEAETVAESVAFIVCDAFGIDTSDRSFPYVANFSKDMKTFAKVMDQVQRISKEIIKAVGGETVEN